MQATFLSAFGATGIDTLFYASAFNLSGHFEVIQSKILQFKYETNHSANNKKELSRDFDELIRYHRQIIDMCEDLTQAYKPIVFMHFLISSLQMCVIAYQLTLVCKTLIIFFIILNLINFKHFNYY